MKVKLAIAACEGERKLRTKTPLLVLTAALALTAGAAPAWASIAIDGGYVQSNAVVNVNADSTSSLGVSKVDTPYVLFTTATTYAVPALANAVDTSGAASASGSAAANADVKLDNSGFSASFSGTTSVLSSGPYGTGHAAGDLGLGLRFTPEASASYQLSYDLSTSSLGCCGSYYSLEDYTLGMDIFHHTTYGHDTSGLLTGSLISGHEYILTIFQSQYPYSEAATISGMSSQTVSFDDEYRFAVGTPAVSAVPEPSVWALLIAGVGLCGLALRLDRRRGWLAPICALAG